MRIIVNSNKKMSNEKKMVMFICIIFVFFFYGGGFMVNYQMDTYFAIDNPQRMFNAMLNYDGRWLNAIIYYILRFPWKNYSIFYGISFVSSLLLMILSLFVFSELLMKLFLKEQNGDIKTVVLVTIISCITIANMFSMEFFLYPDMMIMYILSILLCVKALDNIRKYILEKNSIMKFLLISFFYLFLCAFMSELTAAIYIVISTAFVLFYSKTFKDFVMKQLLVGIPYCMAMISKLVYTKFIVKSFRASSRTMDFVESANAYAPIGKTPQAFVFDRITFGMFAYAIVFMIIVVLLIIASIKHKEYFEIIKGLYLLCVGLFAGLLPYILRLTNDFKPRIYYPLGAILGTFIIYGILKGYLDIFDKNWVKRISVTIFLYASIQWMSFFQMFTDQYISNYEDKYISEMIGYIINEYEEENNTKINYITFYSDAERVKYARGEGWCITQRGFDAGASQIEALNFYLNKNYKDGKKDNEIAEYFIKCNWDTFSDEQIIIKGDTAHICSY